MASTSRTLRGPCGSNPSIAPCFVQPDDALAVSGGQPFARVGKPFGQPVHPKAAVRVQHRLDHGRVCKQPGNGGAERGAQHARAALNRFLSVVVDGHVGPGFRRGRDRRPRRWGRLRKPGNEQLQQVSVPVRASAVIGGEWDGSQMTRRLFVHPRTRIRRDRRTAFAG